MSGGEGKRTGEPVGPPAADELAGYEIDVFLEVDAPLPEAWLRRVAAMALASQHQPAGAAVSVVVCDDATIQELNRRYRRVDRPTDVLAFGVGEGESVPWPQELAVRALGDVVVSWPRAVAQAREAGHAPERELALLVIHGCLHLLGYDHLTDAEQQRMWRWQERILGWVDADPDCPYRPREYVD